MKRLLGGPRCTKALTCSAIAEKLEIEIRKSDSNKPPTPPRGRPPVKDWPEQIPDTPKNVLRAVLAMPNNLALPVPVSIWRAIRRRPRFQLVAQSCKCRMA